MESSSCRVQRYGEHKTASWVAWCRCKSVRCQRASLWFAPSPTTQSIGFLQFHTASNTALDRRSATTMDPLTELDQRASASGPLKCGAFGTHMPGLAAQVPNQAQPSGCHGLSRRQQVGLRFRTHPSRRGGAARGRQRACDGASRHPTGRRRGMTRTAFATFCKPPTTGRWCHLPLRGAKTGIRPKS